MERRLFTLSSKLKKDIVFLVENDDFMIARSDLLIFLKRCLTEGIRVYGIEGFSVNGHDTVPDMDCIIDIDDGMLNEEIISSISRVIEQSKPSTNFFDVTL